jgi:uncharacterized protein YjdB
VGGGTAVITARSAVNNAISDTCTVTVTVPLVGISLSPDPLSITGAGSTGSFTVNYNPPDTTQTGLIWSSDDTNVATVNSTTGLITAVGGGTAVITARSTVNNAISDTCTVTVTVPLVGISLSPDPLPITGVGSTDFFTVDYTPSNTTQTGVTWSSDNPAVARVNATTGRITAVGGGTAVITARSAANNAIAAGATVNVVVPVTGITIPSALKLAPGSTFLLSSALSPGNTTQTGLTWSSDNPAVATVDANTGLVTAVGDGPATITATSTENFGVSADCTVTVQTGYAGAGVNIVFDKPGDETITLDGVPQAGAAFTVTAPSGYARYLWYVDNSYYGSSTDTPSMWIDYSVVPGLHYLTVIVERSDGKHFSKTVEYTVGY